LQLEVEAQNLFSTIVIDLFIRLLQFENLQPLLDYMQEWRLSIWETYFFREFRSKDAIRRSKMWEQQVGGIEAFKWVVYRYV
jgi:hypothetical protein